MQLRWEYYNIECLLSALRALLLPGIEISAALIINLFRTFLTNEHVFTNEETDKKDKFHENGPLNFAALNYKSSIPRKDFNIVFRLQREYNLASYRRENKIAFMIAKVINFFLFKISDICSIMKAMSLIYSLHLNSRRYKSDK